MTLMTFDSEEELLRIKKIFPEAQLVLRIAVEESDAPNPMGKKFGAPAQFWPRILRACKDHNMRLRGVSFHVGSGGCSYKAYENSLKNTEVIFKLAEELCLPKLDLVDIGGGFSESLTNFSTQ